MSYTALFDTGASRIIMSTKASKKLQSKLKTKALFIDDRPIAGLDGIETISKKAENMSINWQKISAESLNVSTADIAIFSTMGFAEISVILGTPFMQYYDFIVDYSNQSVWFKPVIKS